MKFEDRDKNWDESFLECIGAFSSREPDTKKIAEMLMPFLPLNIFRYRGGTDYDIDALDKGYEWAANSLTLNDPEDGNVVFDNYDVMKQVVNRRFLNSPDFKVMANIFGPKLLSVDGDALPDQFENIIRIKFGSMGLVKFKRDIDNLRSKYNFMVANHKAVFKKEFRGRVVSTSYSISSRNDHMWQDYANNYSGYCLEYLLDSSLAGNVSGMFSPVIYRNTPIDMTQKIKEYEARGGRLNSVPSFLVKSLKWSIENEWRYLDYDPSKGQKVFMSKPLRIYVGSRAGDELLEKVMSICKRRSIDVYLIESSSLQLPLSKLEKLN